MYRYIYIYTCTGIYIYIHIWGIQLTESISFLEFLAITFITFVDCANEASVRVVTINNWVRAIDMRFEEVPAVLHVRRSAPGFDDERGIRPNQHAHSTAPFFFFLIYILFIYLRCIKFNYRPVTYIFFYYWVGVYFIINDVNKSRGEIKNKKTWRNGSRRLDI